MPHGPYAEAVLEASYGNEPGCAGACSIRRTKIGSTPAGTRRSRELLSAGTFFSAAELRHSGTAEATAPVSAPRRLRMMETGVLYQYEKIGVHRAFLLALRAILQNLCAAQLY